MSYLKNCATVVAALCILSVIRTAESSSSEGDGESDLQQLMREGAADAMLSTATTTESLTTTATDVVEVASESLITKLKSVFDEENYGTKCEEENAKPASVVEKDTSFFKGMVGLTGKYKAQMDAVTAETTNTADVTPWFEKIKTYMDLVEKGDENGLPESSETKSTAEKSLSTAPSASDESGATNEESGLVANDFRFLRAKTSVESSGQPLNEYWLHLRTFIPKAGSAAASGVDVSNFPPFDIRQGSEFSANYNMNMEDRAKDWGGWALGIYEPTELFDTNDRDWSNKWDDTEKSKTYVKVHIKKNDGSDTYTIEIPESNGKGSSTTHHYCKVALWRGKCCSKTADWSNVQPLTVTSATNPVKFKLKVRVGNPCVPGSYIGGPIMYDMDFELDFSKPELKVSGKQSLFPAYELIHGSNRKTPGAEGRYMRWGVSGHNVYDLMKFPSAIPADTDAMV